VFAEFQAIAVFIHSVAPLFSNVTIDWQGKHARRPMTVVWPCVLSVQGELIFGNSDLIDLLNQYTTANAMFCFQVPLHHVILRNEGLNMKKSASAGSALLIAVGKNIRAARGKLALTQSQLAEQLEIEIETVSRYERGLVAPSFQQLEKIGKVLRYRGSATVSCRATAVKPCAWPPNSVFSPNT
jgi:DNA-binding XRE family transcriptional regulator